jgi:hypothetical protein
MELLLVTVDASNKKMGAESAPIFHGTVLLSRSVTLDGVDRAGVNTGCAISAVVLCDFVLVGAFGDGVDRAGVGACCAAGAIVSDVMASHGIPPLRGCLNDFGKANIDQGNKNARKNQTHC